MQDGRKALPRPEGWIQVLTDLAEPREEPCPGTSPVLALPRALVPAELARVTVSCLILAATQVSSGARDKGWASFPRASSSLYWAHHPVLAPTWFQPEAQSPSTSSQPHLSSSRRPSSANSSEAPISGLESPKQCSGSLGPSW